MVNLVQEWSHNLLDGLFGELGGVLLSQLITLTPALRVFLFVYTGALAPRLGRRAPCSFEFGR